MVAKDTGSAIEQNEFLLKSATNASLTVAIALVLIKIFAIYMTNSVAVLASLIDSAMDVGASVINFFAIRYALMPADEDHRFGHGKAEPLAGLVQSAFIIGSASVLLYEATARFSNPQELHNVDVGLSVMGISLVLTFFLICFQYYVIRKTDSAVIKADSLHYATDLLTNSAALIAIWLASLGIFQIDPVMGLAIGLFIIWGAVKIIRQSLQILMDREVPEEDREAFYQIILAHPDVLGVHDLRSRRSGQVSFIQFHLELEDALTLRRAHEISDAIEAEMLAAFPNLEVLIHEDPIGSVASDRVENRRLKKQ